MVNDFDFDERRGRSRMNGSKGRIWGMKDIIPREHEGEHVKFVQSPIFLFCLRE